MAREYKIVLFETSDAGAGTLNEAAQEGWQVVAICPQHESMFCIAVCERSA